jgi:hypothetical protein
MLRNEEFDEHIDQDAAIDRQKNAEDDGDIDDNQTVLSRVELARTIRKSILSLSHACQFNELNIRGTI